VEELTAHSTDPPEADANRDLYCLECGYNLRGLSGDPRRCPECGHDNPMSELTLPAEIIKEQLKRMETAPTACVAAILIAGLFYLAFFGALLVWANDGGYTVPSSARCSLDPDVSDPSFVLVSLCGLVGVAVVAAFIWSARARSFREACQGNPAWRPALRRYHRVALTIVAPLGVAIVVTGLLLRSNEWLVLLIDGMLLLGVYFLGRWARRELKLIIDPLQRETAVRIARKTLERRMTRAR